MKKLIAAALVLAVTFTACSEAVNTVSSPESALPEPMAAMGQYIEQDITPEFSNGELFDTLSDNTSINANSDGTLYSATHINGRCVFLTYKNEKWVKQNTNDILSALYEKYLKTKERFLYTTQGNISTNKKIGFIVEKAGPSGELFTPALHTKTTFSTSNGNYISGEENNFQNRYFVSVKENAVTSYDLKELEADISQTQEQSEQTEKPDLPNFSASRITRDYTLILPYGKTLLFYNLANNQTKKLGELTVHAVESAEENYKLKNTVAITGDIVCLALEDKLQLKSLSSGETLAEADLSGIDAVTEGADGAFYAIGKSGIWRITSGGISERIIDGAMCAFSAPSRKIQEICSVPDGSFYVNTIINEQSLQTDISTVMNRYYKYTFSPNTPQERAKTLHVWALRDSPSITETAAELMRLYPDTRVYIEALNSQDDLQKEAEAIEQLFKTVKEGKGPDIIITDGINYNNLYQNDVLAPLPSEVSLENYESAFLPAGKKDGVQYSVFGKVILPQVEFYLANYKVSELYSFADNIESFKAEEFSQSLQVSDLPNTLSSASMIFTSKEEMLRYLYISCAAEIWAGNTANEKALTDFLTLCRELNTRYIAENIIQSSMDKRNEHLESTNRYNFLLQGRYIPSIKGIPAEFHKNGAYATNSRAFAGLYNKAGAVLTCGAAVSRCAINKEEAANFINILLSRSVQGSYLSDGANTVKLKNNKGDMFSSYSETVLVNNEISPSNVELALYLPSFARDEAFAEIVEEYLSERLSLSDAITKAKMLE